MVVRVELGVMRGSFVVMMIVVTVGMNKEKWKVMFFVGLRVVTVM